MPLSKEKRLLVLLSKHRIIQLLNRLEAKVPHQVLLMIVMILNQLFKRELR
jgi:hypothetical protein